MFTPVPVELTAYDAEKVGGLYVFTIQLLALYTHLEYLKPLVSVDLVQRAKFSKLRQATMVTDLQQVSASTLQLQDMLHTVMKYVDDVIVSTRSSSCN